MASIITYFDSNGYCKIQHEHRGKKKTIVSHRLVAVAECGFDEVAGNHVHHKNGWEFDNRPENLEVLTPAKHAEVHYEDHHEEQDWWDKEKLQRLYVDEKKSLVDIGDHFGCSGKTIARWLEKYDIERRTTREQKIIEGQIDPNKDESKEKERPEYQKEDVLRELYNEKGLTQSEIAGRFDVSEFAIQYWFGKYNIETGYSQYDSRDYRDEDWLKKMYCDKELSTAEIGDICGVDQSTIVRWVQKFGFESHNNYHNH